MNLRERLDGGETVWAAGVYDALSAKVAEAAGFGAVMTGGYGITASMLGLPDLELLTLSENVGVVSRITPVLGIPVIADIDTGYGNTVNVQRTVREFVSAGAQAVILEDQVSPKRCAACVEETQIVPIEEATAKLRAARDAGGPGLVLIARTDTFDPAEALVRASAYAAAGADLIQPVNKTFDSLDGLREMRRRGGRPLSLQIMNWMEALPPQGIAEVAGLAVHPLVALMTTTSALMANLRHLARSHDCASLPLSRLSMKEFGEFIGFDEMLAGQDRFYQPERDRV